MLVINIPAVEYYDEANEEFINLDEATLELEHSLVSLSKWESKFEKPFLGSEEKTDEETLGYISAMNLQGEVSDDLLKRLTMDDLQAVNKYIGSKMSATWFSEPGEQPKKAPNRAAVTSEVIYYWMVSLNIPFECENWHLNRLFNLIKVCNQKNAPEKKMSRSEIAAKNRRLNAERKAKYKTSG